MEAQLNGPRVNDATEMPNSLIPTPSGRATIRRNSAFTLLRYRVAPFNRYGQATLTMNDGMILQNVMRPSGVEARTRQSVADRMVT